MITSMCTTINIFCLETIVGQPCDKHLNNQMGNHVAALGTLQAAANSKEKGLSLLSVNFKCLRPQPLVTLEGCSPMLTEADAFVHLSLKSLH